MQRPRSRLRTSIAPLVALALALASAPEAAAGGTKTVSVSDFDDFDAGEVEGAAIEGSGKVTVGYVPQRQEIAGAASTFVCEGGKRAYVGTADPATIQVVSAVKRGKKRDIEVKALAELPGVVVTAIAELPGGDLLAATLPGGTIHRVSAKGKVSEFAKLDVAQIWAIVPHQGRILVATGPKGELHSLSSSGGDPKVILDTDEKDLLSVALVGDAVLVGTSPHAKIFQVAKGLDGVLIHDFEGDEVRALALSDRGLLAAVNTFSDRGVSSLDALTKNLNRTSLIGQPPEGSSESKQRAVKASAELYHVNLTIDGKRDLARASEASWESWLSKEKQYFTDLELADAKDSVLVSSSYEGKVYRVRGRRDKATVADFDERQATGLCRLADGSVLATTGDGAAVYRLEGAPAQAAKYKTKVFDAKQPATYGALILAGRGKLKVRARVGPSDEPDKRWSEWRPIVVVEANDGLRGRLDLPRRRYLQLEVELATPESVLSDLQIYYAPENLPPTVKSVELARPSFDADDDDEPESKVTIKWKVDAEDGDDLVYDVRVRPEGGDERQWIRLSDQPVTKKELKWDLGSVPDGRYEVEVVASDEPAVGVSQALSDAHVSPTFVVDRGRPSIEKVKVEGAEIRGLAVDDGGHIHDVAFSVDGKAFRPASASDGIFDEAREDFALTLPGDLEKGRHRVVLRARDAFGNIGTAALVVDR